jgi:uncharacterized membrane protein
MSRGAHAAAKLKSKSSTEMETSSGGFMKTVRGATALSAAIGLALALQGSPSRADTQDDPAVQAMLKSMKKKMEREHLEMCYGINVAGKNDCGTAAHSCHGMAKEARDPASFVLVPTGLCTRIAGGSLEPH